MRAAGDHRRDRRVVLDVVRGLAALAVVAGHLRAFMFDGADPASSVAWKAFVLLTGQAHSAVIVFFVLSGYLVGKHVAERVEDGSWSWTDYAVRRLTRLWIVLVPALVLTAGLDAIGTHLLRASLYLGRLDPGAYGMFLPDAGAMIANHGAATFLGNLVFLQNGICVAAYGVNGPLWSLANEFWYYVIFPLAYYALRSREPAGRRWVCGGLAALICLALPPWVRLYGLIWLCGYLVVLLEPRRDRWIGDGTRPVAAGMLVAFLLASFYLLPRFVGIPQTASDFVTAILFAAILLLASDMRTGHALFTRSATILSEMSYTLYLTHFPLMAFVLAAYSDNGKFEPGPSSVALYGSLFLLVLGFAYALSRVLEGRTGAVQVWLLGLAARPRRPVRGRSPT